MFALRICANNSDYRYINARRVSLSNGEMRFFILRFWNIKDASKCRPVTKCDHMEVLFMAKKAEKCDIVAGNSLATISVE